MRIHAALLSGGLAAGMVACFASASPADFRQAAWGMTQAQVMATEPHRPTRLRCLQKKMKKRLSILMRPSPALSLIHI